MKKALAATLLLWIALSSASSAQGLRWRVGVVPDGPVRIQEFRGGVDARTKRINYAVAYENVSGKDLIAVQFLFVSFDVWDRVLDVTHGLNLGEVEAESAEPSEARWGSQPRKLAAARYTSVSIPEKVRFEDGEIWEATDAEIRAVLRDLTKDLSDPDAEALDRLFEDGAVTADSLVKI